MKTLTDTQLQNEFPHVATQIFIHWGTKKCRNYLSGLVFNTTGRANSNPQGFPPNVLMAIFRLLDEHDTEFPQYKDKKSVWDPV